MIQLAIMWLVRGKVSLALLPFIQMAFMIVEGVTMRSICFDVLYLVRSNLTKHFRCFEGPLTRKVSSWKAEKMSQISLYSVQFELH